MNRKMNCHCHNPILGCSPKFTFFQNKNKKNKNKGWQRGESRPGNQAVIFLEEIQDLIVPHYAQKWRENANSRSN